MRCIRCQAERPKGIAVLPFDRGLQGVWLHSCSLKGETSRAVRKIEGGQQKMFGPRLPLLIVQGMGFRPLAETLDNAHIVEL